MTRVLVLASALLASAGVFAAAPEGEQTRKWADVSDDEGGELGLKQARMGLQNLGWAVQDDAEAPPRRAPARADEDDDPDAITAFVGCNSADPLPLPQEALVAPPTQGWDCAKKTIDFSASTLVETQTSTGTPTDVLVEAPPLELAAPQSLPKQFTDLLDKAEDEIVGCPRGHGRAHKSRGPRAHPPLASFVFPHTHIPDWDDRYTTRGSGSTLRGFQVHRFSEGMRIRIGPLGGTTWLPFPQG